MFCPALHHLSVDSAPVPRPRGASIVQDESGLFKETPRPREVAGRRCSCSSRSAVADRLHETLLVRGEPLDAVEAVRLLIASPNAPVASVTRSWRALVAPRPALLLEDDARGAAQNRCPPGLAAPLGSARPRSGRCALRGPRPGDHRSPAGTSKITEIGAVRIEGFREVRHFSTPGEPPAAHPAHDHPDHRHHPGDGGRTRPASRRSSRSCWSSSREPWWWHTTRRSTSASSTTSCTASRAARLGDGAIDTLPLARALAPGLPNYRLHTVAEALGAPVAACHRALADAQAAGHVFVTLVGRLQEQGHHPSGRSPSVRQAQRPVPRVEKLRLTRDVPRSPGHLPLRRQGRHASSTWARPTVCASGCAPTSWPTPTTPARCGRPYAWWSASTGTRPARPLEAVVREQELILAAPAPVQPPRRPAGELRLPQSRGLRSRPQPLRQQPATRMAHRSGEPGGRCPGGAGRPSAPSLGHRSVPRAARGSTRPWICSSAATPSAAAPGAPTDVPACAGTGTTAWLLCRRSQTCADGTTLWSWTSSAG